MSGPRLYCPQLRVGEVTLDEEEAHHAVNVLRLKTGDRVELFDGQGIHGAAVIQSVARRLLTLSVDEIARSDFELDIRITLAVAMPKAHRQGILIEKCTELGVAEIWPMVTKHSVVKPDRGSTTKWFRRAVEAAKQSGRDYVPGVAEPQTFRACLGKIVQFPACAITDREGIVSVQTFLSELASEQSAFFLVGPEGGWSAEEIDLARSVGCVRVSLGPTILRTETAAIAVCAAAAARSTGRSINLSNSRV